MSLIPNFIGLRFFKEIPYLFEGTEKVPLRSL